MRVNDIWWGIRDKDRHVAGAWDCPCGPWVKTEMDDGDVGLRTVRHVPFEPYGYSDNINANAIDHAEDTPP